MSKDDVYNYDCPMENGKFTCGFVHPPKGSHVCDFVLDQVMYNDYCGIDYSLKHYNYSKCTNWPCNLVKYEYNYELDAEIYILNTLFKSIENEFLTLSVGRFIEPYSETFYRLKYLVELSILVRKAITHRVNLLKEQSKTRPTVYGCIAARDELMKKLNLH